MRLFERLNLGIGIPVLCIHLVAADMEKLIGEQLCHLFDEFVHELVSLFAGRIGDGLVPVFVLDRERARIAGQFGIAHEPGAAVAGRIEFGNDADAAIVRVGD